MAAPSVVVVGGAVAAGALVGQLRADGHTGRIVVVDEDPDAPYDRPPLSKELFRGDEVRPEAPWWDDRCDVVRGCAGALDTAERAVTVTLPGGDTTELSGDHLVIATGAAPVALPGQPPGTAQLRTAADARAIREQVHPGTRAIILGAGTIGTELASSIMAAGGVVTLIDLAPQPLERFLGGHLGAESAQWLRDAGVQLKLDTRIQAVRQSPDTWSVTTDSEELAGDLVISAVGTRPATGWLEGSGLVTDNGVHCTADGEVLDATGTPIPGIWAVGDVAAWAAPDGSRRRREDWTSAQRHGRHVAQRIAGLESLTPLADELDYFWTHQFGRRIQVLGTPSRDAELVQHVEDPDRDAAFYSLELDGEAVAWISINRPKEFALAMRQALAGVG